jgi:LPS export ABC transporter protein LptC
MSKLAQPRRRPAPRACAAHLRRLRRLRRVVTVLALPALAGGGAQAAGAPPLRIEGMTFVASTGPVTELLVAAAAARVDVAANRAELETVSARWAGEDGRTSLELECERGEFDLATNDLVAVGDVRGRLGDGREFRGPWLRYDRANGVAFTDAPVVIIDQGRQLRGGGLRYQVRDRRLRLTAGASVVEPK